MNETYMDRIRRVRGLLNEVGKGFCLMKWRTESLYLHTGDNHSCYHPRPHKVPLAEIKIDVSALHNTSFKKKVRKEMLEGKQPEECYYCWNIEKLDGEHYSDRMFHSSSTWLENTEKEIALIQNAPADANFNPYFLEISFSNNCNFKCGYCCPQSSTMWMDEIKTHGNYPITYNQYGIEFLDQGSYFPDEESNPYVEAFWEWWPELKKDLKVFRITGGEALMHPSTFKLLDMLDADPSPELEIQLNSNMGVANSRVQRLSTKLAKLLAEKKIKTFRLYTSIDSYGKQAEYMRRGLDCNLWEQNLDTYLTTLPDMPISFMITYNVLSVAYFRQLLVKILDLRAKYNVPGSGFQRITFDTPYLKEPPHWMINILPVEEFGHYLDSDLKFIADNMSTEPYEIMHFTEHEFEKFKRVRDYYYQGGERVTDDLIKRGRHDFWTFFNEYDKRSNSSLLETFPLYADFRERCRLEYEQGSKEQYVHLLQRRQFYSR